MYTRVSYAENPSCWVEARKNPTKCYAYINPFDFTLFYLELEETEQKVEHNSLLNC